MFCTNCGKQLSEDSKFCTDCGTVVNQKDTEQHVAANAAQETLTNETATMDTAPAVVAEKTPTVIIEKEKSVHIPVSVTAAPVETDVTRIKRAGGSVGILIATVLYSFMIIMQLIGAFNNTTVSFGDMYMYGEAASIINVFSSVSTIFVIFGMTPSFLIVAGLWVNYYHAKKTNDRETGGLTLVKSAVIIRLVCKFIVVALIVTLFVVCIISALSITNDISQYSIAGDYYGVFPAVTSGSSVISYLIIIAIVFLSVQAIPIIYDFVAISSINSMKRTLSKGKADLKGHGAICVMNYIFVAINTIGLLINIAISSIIQVIVSAIGDSEAVIAGNILSSMFSNNVWSIIPQLVMIVCLILFSVNLTAYKKEQIKTEL